MWCSLFHFPYHRKYTVGERKVKICDVCDRTEQDVSLTRALVLFVLVIIACGTWAGMFYLAMTFWW